MCEVLTALLMQLYIVPEFCNHCGLVLATNVHGQKVFMILGRTLVRAYS